MEDRTLMEITVLDVKTFITWLLFLIISLAVPWAVIGDDVTPYGNLFGLIVLVDVCLVFGWFLSIIPIPKLPPIPPLVGMLIAGFALANIPVINVGYYIRSDWSSALRTIALAIILVKAGLDLDSSALNKMKGACIRLTIIPCIVEAATCGWVCYLLLDFPWAWGFLLGFVLGAVTPAVIVPCVLSLQNKGFGVKKGIPSLVIAASSFDDVLAISGFSVLLGIAFADVPLADESVRVVRAISDGGVVLNATTAIPDVVTTGMAVTTELAELATTTIAELTTIAVVDVTTVAAEVIPPPEGFTEAGLLALKIFRGPMEMVGGIIISIILGTILWCLPDSRQKGAVKARTILVISIGIFATFATRIWQVPGAGPLIAIVTPFVAGMKWGETKAQISKNVGCIWWIFEPILFGLIGAEITIDTFDSETIGLGIAVILICLIFRLAGTFLAISFAGFDLKEKIFLCLAWLPKATVQAAIGGAALDTARNSGVSPQFVKLAETILAISVLSIIITAPLGAAAIGLSGPKLLHHVDEPEEAEKDAEMGGAAEEEGDDDDAVVESHEMAETETKVDSEES